MAADDAAVVVRLQANLKDYEAALKSAVRQTERAAKAAEAAVSGIGKGQGASNVIAVNFQKSAGQIANDARVLQYQLNDIFSGVASGQGIRAVQMQLGQIAQQLGGQGLGAAARTMGAALVSMVNPINLAVVAFGVLATVAASYFSDTDKDAEEARKELDKQADAIKKLAEEYGVLFPELERIANLREQEANAASKAEAREAALAGAYGDTQKIIDGMSGDIATLIGNLQELGEGSEDINKLQEAFPALDKAVADYKATSKDAEPVVAALNKIIANSAGAVQILATAIRDQLVASFEELDRAAASAGEAMERSLQTVGPGRGGDPMPAYRRHSAELESSLGNAADAIDGFVERVIQAESGGRATAKNPLSSATGAGQFISSTWLSVFKSHFAAEAEGMSDAAILALRTDVETNRRMIRAYATDNAKLLLAAGQEVNEASLQLAHFLGAGGAIKVLSAARGTRIADIPGMGAAIAANQSILGGGATREDVLAYAGRRAQAPSRQKENTELEDWLKLSQQELDLKNKQLDINAQFWESEARRSAQMEEQRLIQEGLSAATKQYGTVTDEMRAKIEAAAHAQAFASVASEEAAERQKQLIESQKQSAAQLQQMNQQYAAIIGGGLSAFVQDLIAGEDAGDAFAKMLQRISSQMIDMFIQMMIIKPLMNSLFGGTGGGGILGMEGGGTVGLSGHPAGKRPAALWAGAPRYARGGMVGLKPGEVPIIAHRGEIIVPNARRLASATGGGSVDNSIHQQNKISIDMAGSGYVAANSDSARQVGENIQKLVQAELVRESRPGGLLRRMPG